MRMKRRSNAIEVTFKGKLEASDTCITECNKENFVTALKEQVGFYGLHFLFFMHDTSGEISSLVEDARLFSLL